MLAHLRSPLASSSTFLASCTRNRAVPLKVVRRRIASTASRHAEAGVSADEDALDDDVVIGTGKDDPKFAKWLATEGAPFKDATKPKNWLGGATPFPLNPSFKPPTPLSDELRTSVYTMYRARPDENTPRVIAKEFGLSIARVEAILKLKSLEEEWKERQPLQTGFVAGMERILGVYEAQANRRTYGLVLRDSEAGDKSRKDAQEGDIQVQEEGKEGLRNRERYRRMYWEAVSETEDASMPDHLQAARTEASAARHAMYKAKADAVFIGQQHLKPAAGSKTPRSTPLIVQSGKAEGRPMIKFMDVGGKFMDVKAAKQRDHANKRDHTSKSRRQV